MGKPNLGHNSNAGLRGSKAQIYEGGHRVPFIVSWGNGKKNSPIQPGSQSSALIGLQDLFATFSELSAQSVGLKDALDSQSFLGILLGKEKSKERSTLLLQANNGKFFNQQSKKAIRENQWKLIASKDLKPIELYDLKNDRMETTNLIEDSSQSKRVKRMTRNMEFIFRSERSTEAFRLNQTENLQDETQVHVWELKAPRANLICRLQGIEGGKAENWNQKWKISGTSPLRFSLLPEVSSRWDISGFKLLGIPFQN